MFRAKQIWIAAAVFASAGSAGAQERVKLSLSSQRAIQSAGAYDPGPSWGMKTKPRAAYRSPNSSSTFEVGGITVEKQRTAFLSQVRVPVASFWNGRVQFAGVHQRVREVTSHSAVAVADPAASLGRARFGVLTPHRRATIGGGIWLQIGRPREAVVVPAVDRAEERKESR